MPSRCECFQYQTNAANIASTAQAPGCRKRAGTGIVHSSAITVHTIGGTHSQCSRWLIGFW